MVLISVSDFAPSPMEHVERWIDEAKVAQVGEWDSMMVATADQAGVPSARMVLLRGVSKDGFRFYSNYTSRKAIELAANPAAAIVIYWREQQRQIRATGSVVKLSSEQSVDYWSRRPRESQLSAWASHQSTPVVDREALEAEVEKVRERFGDRDDIPLPEFWGGYLIIPNEVEFWVHRDDRLHDRLVYRKNSSFVWEIVRLQP